ncbi:MAG: hypothetical protein JJE21_09135 [Spirochaetaceae bacterium]|nr:hypothetical protein [Spirochaetaceae bacterium]
MTNLYEKISDDAYEGILRSLKIRSENTDFSLEHVKGELESLYKYEGLDGEGRGDVLQARLEGSILAFEVFISSFEKNNSAS